MGTMKKSTQNYINHIAIVLDASSSMSGHAESVVKVADMQIQHLAEQSKLMDQETRVSVYTFSYRDAINCLIYDKDVLRMPSIAGLYNAYGNTALCSATTLAINDLKLTPEKYGEHSFLIYVITDGMENDSSPNDRVKLPSLIATLEDHWTLAAFVPDARGVHFAKGVGFPANNIAVWNTSSESGFLEVGEIIKQATDTYMQNRTVGIRGSKSLFSMKKVDVADIKKTLTPLTPGSYFFTPVTSTEYPTGKVRIDKFCNDKFGDWQPGYYYEMTKRETIQDYKKIALYIPGDNHLYTGKGVRGLLGLPEDGSTVRISPGDHKGYRIFVQTTAPNRNLFTGTDLLVLR